jgi:Regulator of Vps4 activity in the MVB pathway
MLPLSFSELKMAVSRFQIAANKKTALLKQHMREVAVMLAEDPPREEKARIRAEALIREDNAVEAYEILQLSCELLAERIKLISSMKECPPDLVSSISTLIWACDRVDISELSLIKKQFRAKYGKTFEENALNNVGGILNERVVSKLSVQPPAAYLVQVYLERICEQFEVDWKPRVPLTASEMAEPMAAPVGYSVQVAGASGLGEVNTGMANADQEIGIPQAPTTRNSGNDGYGKGGNDGYDAFSGGGGSGNNGYSKGGNDGYDGFGGGGGSGCMPVVSATPYIPPSSGDTKRNADYEEVDIFVPAIPTAPTLPNRNGGDSHFDIPAAPTGGAASVSTLGGTSTSGGGGATYDDLAARFNQLKK